MSKLYKIQLRPCDAFFFGNERSFGEGDNANYLVHSRQFPQQTSLVGLMRYVILKQKGYDLSGSSRKLDARAETLIGKKSFKIKGENDFKILEKLSPIWISDGTQAYHVAPKNYGLDFKVSGTDLSRNNREGGILLNGKEQQLFSLQYSTDFRSKKKDDAYSAKEPLPADEKLLAQDGKTLLEFKEVFQAVAQIGIHKTARRIETDDEDGLFKMTRFRFKKNFCFEFIVTLSEDIFKEDKELIVQFGGEHSQFFLKASPLETMPIAYFNTPKASKDIAEVVLISDAYVPNSIYENTDFAITETVDFRFITSTVGETERYHNISEKGVSVNDTLGKSEKYNLLERGSVFYVKKDKLQAFEAALHNEVFNAIGYNRYHIFQ